MTRQEFDSRLTNYAVGELGFRERSLLEAELESSQDLREQLVELESTIERVGAELRSSTAKLDAARRTRILEAAVPATRKPKRLRVWPWLSAAALLAGVILLVGLSTKRAALSSARVEVAAASAPSGLDVDPNAMFDIRPAVEPLTHDVLPLEQLGNVAQEIGERSGRSEPERGSGDKYDRFADNPFLRVERQPLSTFSIDVDTASYSLVRRHIESGALPPRGAVRIEELVNYFEYAYAEPGDGRPFAIHTDVAAAPWAPNHRLLRVALKGKTVASNDIPAKNLVFLIDVSGSMADADKLPLLRRGLSLLVQQLDERDTISIVVYAGASGLALPATSGQHKTTILRALERLESGGSTNGGEGIVLAYQVAREHFVAGGVNRVILATDGDFNVGITDQKQLIELIEKSAARGVFLSVLGFGRGNYNDSLLEKLADKGNGNYAYVDSPSEARKVLVEQATGTLITIAKDVKIQVELNPRQVESFRLLGYENRVLAREDFEDDRKDAGELGAGHTVTALYELVPARERVAADANEALATVKLRYKLPTRDFSELMQVRVRDSSGSMAQGPADFRFAAAVAEFGMLLRESPHKGEASYEHVVELASTAADAPRRREFIELVRRAQALASREPRRGSSRIDEHRKPE